MKSKAAVIAALLMALMTGACEAAEPGCTPESASTSIPNRTDKVGNTGVVPRGFVKPRTDGPVVDGIDVSRYQDKIDFETLKRCGGAFAYVRLYAGGLDDNELTYRDHWKNAKGVGLLTGGYHNLFVNNPTVSFTDMKDKDRQAVDEGNVQEAARQAGLFMTRLNEMLDLDPNDTGKPDQLGAPYLPAVLDLTWQPQAKFGSGAVKAFAPSYRRAICSWIKTFQADPRFTGQPVILFTTPKTFAAYEFDQLPCRSASDKWWVSVHGRDGGNAYDAEGDDLKAVSAMCGGDRSPGRCIFDQYTSFGGFALFERGAAMDLDRFYGSLSDLRNILQQAHRNPGASK